MSILSLQEESKMKETLVEQNGELGAVAHLAAWGEEQLFCSFALSQNSLYKTGRLCLRPKTLHSECRDNCHSKSCYSTACESQSVFGRGITMLDLPQSMEHGRHPKELLSQWAAVRDLLATDQPFPSSCLYPIVKSRAFITVWCLSSTKLPSWWLIRSTGIFLLGAVSPALRNGEICYKLKRLRLTASPQLSYCWFHLQWATHTATRIIMRWESTGLHSGGRISMPGLAL